MRKPLVDEDRGGAMGRSSVARRRWCKLTATGLARSRVERQPEKREPNLCSSVR